MGKLTDNFTFGLVMQDKHICEQLINMILPDENLGDVIMRPSSNPFYDNEKDDMKDEIIEVTRENYEKYKKDGSGVRFDILAKGTNTWTTVEMQTYKETDIGKRCRYYQTNMDLEMIDRGMTYRELRRSFIIFICTYDPYKMDEPIYFFETYDRKNGLQIGDFSYKIILNTKCSPEKVPDKLKGFYEYIRNPETADKVGFIKELDDRVSKFDTEDWRVREVTLEELIDGKAAMEYERGLEQGHLEASVTHALAMKKRGIGFKIISEITGLSIEEIEKLN